MVAKKQKRKAGDVVSIPLTSGRYAFGQVLDEPLIAFFDYEAEQPDPPEILQQLSHQAVAFAVWVMNHAVKSGRWMVIGSMKTPSALDDKPRFFEQDAISGSLSITTDGSTAIPATKKQCAHLERAAVWDPSHIEDRLEDHFKSRPNKWVESLRLR